MKLKATISCSLSKVSLFPSILARSYGNILNLFWFQVSPLFLLYGFHWILIRWIKTCSFKSCSYRSRFSIRDFNLWSQPRMVRTFKKNSSHSNQDFIQLKPANLPDPFDQTAGSSSILWKQAEPCFYALTYYNILNSTYDVLMFSSC